MSNFNYNKQRHLELLKLKFNKNDYIQEVLEAINSMSLEPVREEDKPDLHKILSSYHILIERIVFWSSHQNYNLLVQKFLNKEMDGFQFQEAFLNLWYSDSKKIEELIKTIEEGDNQSQIPDFCYTSKSIVFSDAVSTLFFAAEGLECEANESDLRSLIQEYYFPTLRKSCDPDGSFFPSRIDFDP